ncbi:MAG: GTPase Era [Nitrospiria bacterium]
MSYRAGFISIIGQPNVGKSTLLNQILGQKIAIITDKPQTTRNRILGVYHFSEGQMVFLDTPGIHQARGGLNRRMVQTAFATLQEIDLVLFVIDPLKKGNATDLLIKNHLRKINTPQILVVNKIDILDPNQLVTQLDRSSREEGFSEVIPLSALTGKNVDRLLTLLKSYLPEGSPFFPEDIVTDQPIRFLASEIVREKLIQETHEEVPYIIATQIESFKEDLKRNLATIHITLYVESNSQKGIIIGRKGQMLKKIGGAARRELEALLGMKVFLGLWVKVRRGWRSDERFLNQMGY